MACTANFGIDSISQPKNKTDMRTINYNQAQQIIDVACSGWKGRLANMWGVSIAMKTNEIPVQEDFYKEMRVACTAEQHKLFDDIFGSDAKFKVGDYVIVKNYHPKHDGIPLKVIDIVSEFVYWEDPNYSNSNFHIHSFVRLATKEEIEATNWYPDGTPCLVSDSHRNDKAWNFRYADGKGSFYPDSKKRGSSVKWQYHMKLDMNNLPVSS